MFFFSCKNSNLAKKSYPLFSNNPPLKIEILSSPLPLPPLENLVEGSNIKSETYLHAFIVILKIFECLKNVKVKQKLKEAWKKYTFHLRLKTWSIIGIKVCCRWRIQVAINLEQVVRPQLETYNVPCGSYYFLALKLSRKSDFCCQSLPCNYGYC